jgi:hypothetical protein
MPAKAVAGAAASTAGSGLAGALVAVCLFQFGSSPPEAIVIAYTTIASTVLAGVSTFLGVYLTRMEGSPAP